MVNKSGSRVPGMSLPSCREGFQQCSPLVLLVRLEKDRRLDSRERVSSRRAGEGEGGVTEWPNR